MEMMDAKFNKTLNQEMLNNNTMNQEWFTTKIDLSNMHVDKLRQWDKTVIVETLKLLDNTVIDKVCSVLLFDWCIMF